MSVYDDATEQGYDLTDYTVEVRVNDKAGCQVLATTASKSDDDDSIQSVISWTFPAAQMAGLAPGSYRVAVRIVSPTSTRQILLGNLPLVSGGFE